MRSGRTISTVIAGLVAVVLWGLPFSHALSQGVYNASNLYILGTAMYVDGAVRNTGALENNGHLAVSADWDSKGAYEGEGTLEVYGNAPQKVAHYGQDIAGLLINGWGVKYIKGALNVVREIHLNRGILEVSSRDVLKLHKDVTISGGNDKSYVDGAITVEGTGYKFFPIGKNGTYAPIEFLDVKGEFPEFSVEVFENAPVISVEDVIIRRGLYWHRNDLRGTFSGSAVAIDFERNYFQDPLNIVLVAGREWDQPFQPITGIEHSTETNKISSRSDIHQPILMLGEISERWTSADFYFSTALSPNAAFPENRSVRIFGERLAEDGFRFQVFNRWGEGIYESTSLAHMSATGWDGHSMNGVQLPAGSYPYHMHAYDKTGKKFEKKGLITLIY